MPPGGWAAPAAVSFAASAPTAAVQTLIVLPSVRLVPVLSSPTSPMVTLATGGVTDTWIPAGEPVVFPVPGESVTAPVMAPALARLFAVAVTVIVDAPAGASPG